MTESIWHKSKFVEDHTGGIVRVVVIGAFGLIGSSLVQYLAGEACTVLSIDLPERRSYREGWKRKAAAFREFRVRQESDAVHLLDVAKDFATASKLLESFRPDVIVNCGGNSLASDFSSLPDILDETVSSLNEALLVCSVSLGCRYVFLSSSMVYGDLSNTPLQEDAPKKPIDPYGALKLGCEHLIRAFAYQHLSLDYAILRPSAVYGALDSNERILLRLLHAFDEDNPIVLRDQNEVLDFTPVKHLAEKIARAVMATGPIRTSFNVSNGQGYSIAQAVAMFEKILGPVPVDTQSVPEDDIKRPRRGALSNDKHHRVFGSIAAVPLERGLQQLVAESRELGLVTREADSGVFGQ